MKIKLADGCDSFWWGGILITAQGAHVCEADIPPGLDPRKDKRLVVTETAETFTTTSGVDVAFTPTPEAEPLPTVVPRPVRKFRKR